MISETNPNRPFVSVVVPVYNKEEFIARAIRSVLDQTFSDFELIIVLDPSTDGSDRVASSFTDERIKIIRRDRPGPGGYAARNAGIKSAYGRWVSFLDADDSWEPDYLNQIRSAIEAQPSVEVFVTGYQIETAGKLYPHSYARRFSGHGNHIISFEKFLLLKPISSINVACLKSLMDDIGGFPEDKFRRGADQETWLRMMNRARKAYWIDYIGATYYKAVAGSVTNSNEPYVDSHPVSLRVAELLKRESDHKIRKALKRYSNSFVISGLSFRARNGTLALSDFRVVYFLPYLISQARYRSLLLFSILPRAIKKKIAKKL